MRVIHGPASDSVVLGVSLVDHVVVTVQNPEQSIDPKAAQETMAADWSLCMQILISHVPYFAKLQMFDGETPSEPVAFPSSLPSFFKYLLLNIPM